MEGEEEGERYITTPTEQTSLHNSTTTTTTTTSITTTSIGEFPQHLFVQYAISDALLTIVPPLLLLLGTFGNVMTVLVMRALTQAGGNHLGDPSMGIYFPCLAVSDQIVLTVGLGRKWLKATLLYDIRHAHSLVCKLHRFVIFLFSRTSSWILVAVTSQRVMTVMWPLRQRLKSTRKRALAVVVIIVGVSCFLDTGILVLYSHVRTDSGDRKCQAVKDTVEAAFYVEEVYPWLNIVTGSVLPLFILVLNNVILAHKVRQSLHASSRMTDAKRTDALAKKASSLSLTLIVTSLAFVLLTSPIPATFVIKVHLPSWWWMKADVFLLDTVLDLLWYCNSSVNFYLYFLTGPTFRREASRLLCVGRKRHSSSSSSSSRGSTMQVSTVMVAEVGGSIPGGVRVKDSDEN